MAREQALSPAALQAALSLAAGRPYAERADIEPPWHDQVAQALLRATLQPLQRRAALSGRGLQSFVARVDVHEADLRQASDQALQQAARRLRVGLRQQGFGEAIVAETFALVREAAARTLGQRHYPPQLMAGWALVQGRLIEMATGEGKTFAATLPACAMALARVPVHIVTVNDYLAQRDADAMGPLYAFLGLRVGVVVQGLPPPVRHQAYACDITYCTNKELAFDYLRDRTSSQGRGGALHQALRRLDGQPGPADGGGPARGLALRGLHYALVDEADSVFIDEARTPLILSATVEGEGLGPRCELALSVARTLRRDEHFKVETQARRVSLLDAGRDEMATACAGQQEGVLTSRRAREELLVQALAALHLYQRDVHYVLAEGKVQIVDESTGRVMPDRSWERGLHQMIECREGVPLTSGRDTLARLTYQRLFRRYLRLAGMTGTAAEVAGEIETVYRLPVVRIPLYRPARRTVAPTLLCRTLAEKWQRVADIATTRQAQGQPVLIGTRTVGDSEQISAVLTARGIAHALLNAKQDRDEAGVIAQAGAAGRVTVATNMAGRGTDIRLEDGVAERGGLHVVLTEFHESRRIDRQLYGRCARQSDPGSCQAVVSLDDELFRVFAPLLRRVVRLAVIDGWGRRVLGDHRLAELLRRRAQHAAETRHARQRIDNMRQDDRLQQVLAFSGKGE